jgi:dolichol-phosphate mannosyltransferase
LDKISKRYFFESDMLINLNIENKVVKDISIPAKYGDESSSLNISKIIYQFPPKLMKGLFKRIFLKYFIYNFNMLSIYLLLGIPLFLFGVVFGMTEWLNSIKCGIEASTGTVMLAVLPIILGVEFLLQAINIDIYSEPKDKF